MDLITVDKELCNKDGICSLVCVSRIIEPAGDDTLPWIREQNAEYCISCGHCVAACPTGALNHRLTPKSDCLPWPQETRFDPDNVETLLRSRRSIRNYRNKAVPREIIARLLDAARYAPTGANLQNCRYIVCDDPEKLHVFSSMIIDGMKTQLADGQAGEMADRTTRLIEAWDLGLDPILRHAPAVIAAHFNSTVNNSPVNCALALSFVDVMAHALGLGTCFCGYFAGGINSSPALKQAIGLPEGHTVATTLLLGYPRITYQRIPARNPAKFKYI